MKKIVTPLCLLAMAFGFSQLPALADFSLDFGGSDRNHDHRWNYNEFQNANKYYYHHHHGVHVVSNVELRHHFDGLDRDHDGYITVDEARGYRNWD